MLNQRQTASPPARWGYGEHASVIGDTGSGKTTLISKLTEYRKYAVLLRTKSDSVKFPGFEQRSTARSMDNLMTRKILLKPDYDHQRREVQGALDRAYKQGHWTMVVDELLYVERLKLTWAVDKLLTQGRSEGITVVVGMQRPVAISRWAISQSTHVFCFQVEGRDVATMAESLGYRVVEPLQGLEWARHDFVYYNRHTREIKVGNANRLHEVIVGANGIY